MNNKNFNTKLAVEKMIQKGLTRYKFTDGFPCTIKKININYLWEIIRWIKALMMISKGKRYTVIEFPSKEWKGRKG